MPKPVKSKQQLTVKESDDKPLQKGGPRGNVDLKKTAAEETAREEISVDLLRERRYLWTARAFAIVSAVALCVNLVLLLAIVHMMPLKRVEPFLLTFQNKADQDMSAEDIISEAMIRQYVLLRNTMISDVDEMSFRWGPDGPLRWMSSAQVYNQFA